MDCADALDMANDMKKSGLDTYAAYLSGGDWTVYVKDASVSAVEAAADENASRVSFEGVAITGGEPCACAGECRHDGAAMWQIPLSSTACPTAEC